MMGIAAYNRGSRVLRNALDREAQDRRTVRMVPCGGRMSNGPSKRYGRCLICGAIDYEAYEGDRCRRMVRGE